MIMKKEVFNQIARLFFDFVLFSILVAFLCFMNIGVFLEFENIVVKSTILLLLDSAALLPIKGCFAEIRITTLSILRK